jgi:membrane-associated phospholipid phosphatase
MKTILFHCCLMVALAGRGGEFWRDMHIGTDSIPGRSNNTVRPIDAKSFILPGALIGTGALLTFSASALDSLVQEEIQEAVPGFHSGVDNIFMVAPTVAVFGLNAAGVKGKHSILRATEYYIVALLISVGTSEIMKEVIHVQRPDGSNDQSFPSGHTTNAFMGAEFLHQEYGHRSAWYTAAGYTTATATGLLRMANNRHWLGDVVAGAGIGILSTRFSYWLVPRLNKAIRKDKHPPAVLKF